MLVFAIFLEGASLFGADTMPAVKVRMNPDLNINEAVENINELERKLKAQIPKLKWCFVEPDVVDCVR